MSTVTVFERTEARAIAYKVRVEDEDGDDVVLDDELRMQAAIAIADTLSERWRMQLWRNIITRQPAVLRIIEEAEKRRSGEETLVQAIDHMLRLIEDADNYQADYGVLCERLGIDARLTIDDALAKLEREHIRVRDAAVAVAEAVRAAQVVRFECDVGPAQQAELDERLRAYTSLDVRLNDLAMGTRVYMEGRAAVISGHRQKSGLNYTILRFDARPDDLVTFLGTDKVRPIPFESKGGARDAG